jgi:hypothetical protein
MSSGNTCPDISGLYSNQDGGARLSEVFGLPPSETIRLEIDGSAIIASSGRGRRVLALHQDFSCTSEEISLSRPMTGGYEISGVLSDHVDRYVILARGAQGALLGRTLDKERVKFIGPELTAAGRPGPQWRWVRRQPPS